MTMRPLPAAATGAPALPKSAAVPDSSACRRSQQECVARLRFLSPVFRDPAQRIAIHGAVVHRRHVHGGSLRSREDAVLPPPWSAPARSRVPLAPASNVSSASSTEKAALVHASLVRDDEKAAHAPGRSGRAAAVWSPAACRWHGDDVRILGMQQPWPVSARQTSSSGSARTVAPTISRSQGERCFTCSSNGGPLLAQLVHQHPAPRRGHQHLGSRHGVAVNESLPGTLSTSKVWCACLMSDTRSPCFTKSGLGLLDECGFPASRPTQTKCFHLSSCTATAAACARRASKTMSVDQSCRRNLL